MKDEDEEIHERFVRMVEQIHICIAQERPFVDIAGVIRKGLKSPAPSASKEWPEVVLEDILDAEYIEE